MWPPLLFSSWHHILIITLLLFFVTQQQATYLTPESQARFLRYWMKQSRKRGTQAVLDFKQSSLQRYLADRKPVIDTLVRTSLAKKHAYGVLVMWHATGHSLSDIDEEDRGQFQQEEQRVQLVYWRTRCPFDQLQGSAEEFPLPEVVPEHQGWIPSSLSKRCQVSKWRPTRW